MTNDPRSGLSAVIHADGSAVLTVDETPETLPTASAEDARREIVRRVAEIGQLIGGPVDIVVHEPDGSWPLRVHPDGQVESEEGVAHTRPDDAPGSPTPDARGRDQHLEADGRDAPPAWAEPSAPGERSGWGGQPAPGEQSGWGGQPEGDESPVQHEPSAPGEAPDEQDRPAGAEQPAPGEQPAREDHPSPGEAGDGSPAVTADEAALPSPVNAVGGPHPDTHGPDAPRPEQTEEPARRHETPTAAASTRAEARRSFLAPERREEPATRGWRGALVSLGLRVPPNRAERLERDDAAAVSQHWAGPRTIAVVNGKGGSGKTPTAILTAAVFARHGGAGVLAWDNNQTRGTLGWRTEQGPHESTLHELLPRTGRLLSPGAQSADLARYVHHQTRDRFDVLRSKPMALADEQRLDSDDVDRIHAVAAKYYRLIVMDSGNDESDPMWLRMIDHTDQLVVATTTRGEHAEAGALLLEALAARDERSAALARGAVAVVSQADPSASGDDVRRVVAGYHDLAREVVTIPYDRAMIGGNLSFGALRPATRRAWLAAGAAIARGLPA